MVSSVSSLVLRIGLLRYLLVRLGKNGFRLLFVVGWFWFEGDCETGEWEGGGGGVYVVVVVCLDVTPFKA